MNNGAVFFSWFTGDWIEFRDPVRVLDVRNLKDVRSALEQVDMAAAAGYYAAGFISYEAAPALDTALITRRPSGFPLIWFGIYDRFQPLNLSSCRRKNYSVGEWRPTINNGRYRRDFDRIREYIADGNTYQVNYTYRLHTAFSGDPMTFFLDLVEKQQTPWNAFLEPGDIAICSVSPELFFLLEGRLLTAKPMKGTAARGRFLSEDRNQADWLFRSEKNRAENTMIVDMVRNDLGRIADYDSVKIGSLYDIETYPTAFQMTSTVTAETDASFSRIICALFPGASVTGTPKASTMQIIRKLESTPRKLYTGAIGFVAPGRKAQFNIAIRTVLIDHRKHKAEYGTGGGIVADSEAVSEFTESLTKARVLTAPGTRFGLLETLLWTPERGYLLLDRHLKRLHESSLYFDFAFDEDRIRARLESLPDPRSDRALRIRLILNRDGSVTTEKENWVENLTGRPVKVAVSDQGVDSANPMLFHKTTDRRIYENALKRHATRDDVILVNERGEVTETTICNIVIETEDGMFTPALKCGLLPGTFRGWLLDQKKIVEKVILRADLFTCKKIYLINSVRQWQPAELADKD
jgi:para-aminobenzoate synthetase/4-amino-4-deoxychorismate lyase